MNDLISRQAAIDVLEERLQANGYSNVALVSELNRSIGYLMQLPSAQPERKTGRWIIYDIALFDGGVDVKCSECGQCGCAPYWDFCPNCGAKMEVHDAD